MSRFPYLGYLQEAQIAYHNNDLDEAMRLWEIVYSESEKEIDYISVAKYKVITSRHLGYVSMCVRHFLFFE